MIARTPVSLMDAAPVAERLQSTRWPRRVDARRVGFAAAPATLGFAWLALVAIAAALLCPPRALAAEYGYVYGGQFQRLYLDPSRVAVFGLTPAGRGGLEALPDAADAAAVGGVALSLRRHGLSPEAAQPWPIAGWSLMPTPSAWAATVDAAPDGAALEHAGAFPPATDFEANVARVARDLAPHGGFVSPIFANEQGEIVFLAPDVMIALDSSASSHRVNEVLRRAMRYCGPAAAADEPWAEVLPSLFRLRTDLANGFHVLTLANRVSGLTGVRFAEPDFIMTVKRNLIPSDPDFNQSWGLHNTGQTGGVADADIDAVEAWDTTTGSSEVFVVVIDDGIERNHPDIRQVAGQDFTSDNGDGGPVTDFDNHGTAVAGIITGQLNNSLGSVGVAPKCYSTSARVFISISANRATSQASWTVNALVWAWGSGAQITNNSNEYPLSAATIGMAYDATRELGVMHFASAGNDGLSTVAYPARLKSVNAVGAFTDRGERATFSNYGVDLYALAPGEAIYTTDRTGRAGFGAGDFASVSGTSFATGFASGIAALVYSIRPNITPDELQYVLQRSCVDSGLPGFDENTGWGLVNADRAVSGPVEQAKLRASDGQAGDSFGQSVAISGDVAIVGAHLDSEGANRSGAAFIYRLNRNNGNWVEEAKLAPNAPTIEGYFGWSVAIDGDLAVVGAPFDSLTATNAGAIYVFRYDPGAKTWNREARLVGSTTNQFDAFGFSVDVRNGIIAAGAYLDDDLGQSAGIGYVFEYNTTGGQWFEASRLFALDGGADDWFGFSVAVDPVTNKVAVGSVRHQSHRGAVYVYRRETSGQWRQEAKLMASDNGAFDWFGNSVDINNDFILVGAPLDDDLGEDSGSAYAFRFESGAGRWIESQKLHATEGGLDTHFGHVVCMTSSTAVVTSVFDRDYGINAGAGYVFRLDGVKLIWNEDVKLYSSDLRPGDVLGTSAGIDLSAVVLGAPGDDEGSVETGAAYIFNLEDADPRYRLFVSPDTLKFGQEARFVVQGALPFTNTYLVYSATGLGSTFIRQINGTVDLDRAVTIFGARETNDVGFVQWIQPMPPGSQGRPVWFQSAQEGALSNVVETIIEP